MNDTTSGDSHRSIGLPPRPYSSVRVDEDVIGVTASFGIAEYPGSEAAGAEELVKRADRALYRAKKAGKNRVELY